jgi:dihydroxy-acid dehydratase
MTPESYEGGGIGLLKSGDVIHLQLRDRRIDFVDSTQLHSGKVIHDFADHFKEERQSLAAERKQRMKVRQKMVAASNRMFGHTDAANGVVPIAVIEDAVLDYEQDIIIHEKKVEIK